jgi:hypothetical protein
MKSATGNKPLRPYAILCLLALLLAALACSSEQTTTEAPAQPAQITSPADPGAAEGSPPAAPALEAGATPTMNTVFLPEVGAGAGSTASPVEGPQANPHVEIQASSLSLRVGEQVTITAIPVDIGLPYYSLLIQDEGVPEAALVEVTYENRITPKGGASQALELVLTEGKLDRATFVLAAKAPGTATLWVSATGEVHDGAGGPATWSGGGSDKITITVTE